MKVGTITKTSINSLPISPASGSKTFVWESGLPGFGAYRSGTKRVSFIYQYKNEFGMTRSKLIGYLGELTIEQARSIASDYAHQRRRGIDPLAEMQRLADEEKRKTELLLSVYAEGYIERRIASRKPLNEAQTRIVRNDVVRLLGDVRIDRMTVEDVEGFAATLAERGPSARRMGLTYLKAILNEAVARDKIGKSPAIAVETNKSGERSRRLREDELQRLLEAAHDLGGPRGDVVEVLVRLAKRKEEVSKMVWEDIDIAERIWLLPDVRSKNGDPYRIELPAQVMEIILGQQLDGRLRKGPVFTLDGGRTSPEMGSQVKDLLDALLHRRLELANERDGTALSVQHYTIHDLRTSVASRLEEEPFQIPASTIDAILLHKKAGKVTRTYQRASLNTEAGKAIQRWNDHVDQLLKASSAWPGGSDLPPMDGAERRRRLKVLRERWPLRTDQQRALDKRAAADKA